MPKPRMRRRVDVPPPGRKLHDDIDDDDDDLDDDIDDDGDDLDDDDDPETEGAPTVAEQQDEMLLGMDDESRAQNDIARRTIRRKDRGEKNVRWPGQDVVKFNHGVQRSLERYGNASQVRIQRYPDMSHLDLLPISEVDTFDKLVDRIKAEHWRGDDEKFKWTIFVNGRSHVATDIIRLERNPEKMAEWRHRCNLPTSPASPVESTIMSQPNGGNNRSPDFSPQQFASPGLSPTASPTSQGYPQPQQQPQPPSQPQSPQGYPQQQQPQQPPAGYPGYPPPQPQGYPPPQPAYPPPQYPPQPQGYPGYPPPQPQGYPPPQAPQPDYSPTRADSRRRRRRVEEDDDDIDGRFEDLDDKLDRIAQMMQEPRQPPPPAPAPPQPYGYGASPPGYPPPGYGYGAPPPPYPAAPGYPPQYPGYPPPAPSYPDPAAEALAQQRQELRQSADQLKRAGLELQRQQEEFDRRLAAAAQSQPQPQQQPSGSPGEAPPMGPTQAPMNAEQWGQIISRSVQDGLRGSQPERPPDPMANFTSSIRQIRSVLGQVEGLRNELSPQQQQQQQQQVQPQPQQMVPVAPAPAPGAPAAPAPPADPFRIYNLGSLRYVVDANTGKPVDLMTSFALNMDNIGGMLKPMGEKLSEFLKVMREQNASSELETKLNRMMVAYERTQAELAQERSNSAAIQRKIDELNRANHELWTAAEREAQAASPAASSSPPMQNPLEPPVAAGPPTEPAPPPPNPTPHVVDLTTPGQNSIPMEEMRMEAMELEEQRTSSGTQPEPTESKPSGGLADGLDIGKQYGFC